MSAPEGEEGASPSTIAQIIDALATVQRLAGALRPGHRQGLLIVAIERALAIAEHYDTPTVSRRRPDQCKGEMPGHRCILEEGHPRAHRSAAGGVWS